MSIEWLNYHHLFYYWQVCREGTIQAASRKLRLAPSTISAQLKVLEEQLGYPLMQRVGRRLKPTEEGRMVLRYADEIFSLGREMLDTLAGRPTGQPLRLRVGSAMVVPKLVVRRFLQPALEMDEPVHLICTEDRPQKLLTELALHTLDMVLMDGPIPPGVSVQAFNHPLGSCPVTLLGAPSLVEKYREGLPGSLDGAPFLLPTEHASMRRNIERWFRRNDIRPRVVAEFQDSALKKVYGQAGHGLFAVPAMIAEEVCEHYSVEILTTIDAKERFYAITVDRRISNPAVATITTAARQALEDFSD